MQILKTSWTMLVSVMALVKKPQSLPTLVLRASFLYSKIVRCSQYTIPHNPIRIINAPRLEGCPIAASLVLEGYSRNFKKPEKNSGLWVQLVWFKPSTASTRDQSFFRPPPPQKSSPFTDPEQINPFGTSPCSAFGLRCGRRNSP